MGRFNPHTNKQQDELARHEGATGAKTLAPQSLSLWLHRLALLLAAITLLVFVVRLLVPGSGRGEPTTPSAGYTLEVEVSERTQCTNQLLCSRYGAPLPAARVRLYVAQAGSYPLIREVTSDERGTVRFDGLGLEAYWVLADDDAHARQSVSLRLSPETTQLRLSLPLTHTTEIQVLEATGEPIAHATALIDTGDLLPYAGVSDARGQVTFGRLPPGPWNLTLHARGFESLREEGVAGPTTLRLRRLSQLNVTVLDVEGAPAPGASVSIVGAALFPARHATADAQGIAQIAGLAAGSYDLKARHGDLISVTYLGYEVEAGSQQGVTLALTPGRHIRVLVRGDEGPDAKPIARAEVVVVEGGIGSFPLQAKTDDSGYVSLGPVTPGSATVSASADGFVGRSALHVETGTDFVELALRRAATLEGTVTDAAGQAVQDAVIEISGTDIDGLPILESARSAAFRRHYFEWSLGQREPPSAELNLGVTSGPVPNVAAALEVLSQSSAAQPRLWTKPKTPVAEWRTDTRGHFVATPLPAGDLRALVTHPDYVEARSEVVHVRPGERGQVKVVLQPGVNLQGRVLAAEGEPVSGATVTVSTHWGSYRQSRLSLHDGGFSFEHLPDQVTLELSRPGVPHRVVLTRSLETREYARQQLELELPPARPSVSVRVLDERERPVARAQVRLLSVDPNVPLSLHATTDESGTAVLQDALGLQAVLQVSGAGQAPFERHYDELPERVTLAARPGVPVAGRVTAVRGRQYVGQAHVVLISEGQRASARTREDGYFEFANVALGAAVLQVAHEQYASAEQRIVIEDTGHPGRAFDVGEIDLQDL